MDIMKKDVGIDFFLYIYFFIVFNPTLVISSYFPFELHAKIASVRLNVFLSLMIISLPAMVDISAFYFWNVMHFLSLKVIYS